MSCCFVGCGVFLSQDSLLQISHSNLLQISHSKEPAPAPPEPPLTLIVLSYYLTRLSVLSSLQACVCVCVRACVSLETGHIMRISVSWDFEPLKVGSAPYRLGQY